MNQIIVIKDNVKKKFNEFFKNGRIIFLNAPCGFGKTTVSKFMLDGKRTLNVTAGDFNFFSLNVDKTWDFLVAEEVNNVTDTAEQQRICEIIRDNPKKKFVFMTRGMMPGWLAPFFLTGLMITVGVDDLFLDKKSAVEVFDAFGVSVPENELSAIMHDSLGYPLAISVIARLMSKGRHYDSKLIGETLNELYHYFDEMIFKRFDLPIRRFLLELVPFDTFGTELAKMVSGDSRAGENLAFIQQNTSMMIFDGLDTFHFWPIFHDFLIWKQNRDYSKAQQYALYSRGGLYYELNENYAKALEYYSKAKDTAKVSELLIKTTQLHPGMNHYEEMEKYYLSLSESQIRLSPALMQGISMLCALHADYEGSEKWYSELKKFADVRNKSDAAAKDARSRLIWLDISLPQRGVTGIIDTVKHAFVLLKNKDIKLPPFSVTSTLPSIMNGGKDFSEWSKIDDLLYATARIPVEAVLGKDGVGLADCAVAESKFEKGEDISDRMIPLVSKISEIQSKGTPDIEFALVGLLVRMQTDLGRIDDARRTLYSLKERYAEKGYDRFEANINAMMCRLALRCGDGKSVYEWYRDYAPKDIVNFRIMKRYLYFTQAMVEISKGDGHAALITLSPLNIYCKVCSRNIDFIHLKILSALAKKIIGDMSYENDFAEAVKTAEKFGFVHTVSVYGACTLLMLKKYPQKTKFVKKVIEASRKQAVFYPDYFLIKSEPYEELTKSELQVLRLLCADKSNSEIGEILGISLATVKSHVSHILQKLGVSRRSEAKTVAIKYELL